MDSGYWIEREYFEKELLRELNDSKDYSREYYKKIQNNSRPNNYNRNSISKRQSIFRGIDEYRKTEDIIVTKFGKTRVHRLK